MIFLTLSPSQLQAFNKLKSSEELQHHGPLGAGEQVPSHAHTSKALYHAVTGAAVCITNNHAQDTLLGLGQRYNAVLVEPEEQHGWLAIIQDTIIEHCFDTACDTVITA